MRPVHDVGEDEMPADDAADRTRDAHHHEYPQRDRLAQPFLDLPRVRRWRSCRARSRRPDACATMCCCARRRSRDDRRMIERLQQLRRRAESLVRRFPQAAVDDVRQPLRHVRVARQRIGRAVEHARERRQRRPGLKWMAARDPFVHQHAERKHVGGGPGRAPFDLFGRHVRRACRRCRRAAARSAWPRCRRACLDAREAEVEHLDAPVPRAHHVFRLEIAMRDALGVRARERRRQLARGRDDRLERWPLAARRSRRAACAPRRTPSRCTARRRAPRARRPCRCPDASAPRRRALRGAGDRDEAARASAAAASAFSATVRPSRPSDARYTRPMPPRPISRTTV